MFRVVGDGLTLPMCVLHRVSHIACRGERRGPALLPLVDLHVASMNFERGNGARLFLFLLVIGICPRSK